MVHENMKDFGEFLCVISCVITVTLIAYYITVINLMHSLPVIHGIPDTPDILDIPKPAKNT